MGGYQHTDPGRAPVTADDVRADATRYLTRTGNTDLLDVLGLVDAPAAPPATQACPVCGKPPPWSGVCRRTKACRAGEEGA